MSIADNYHRILDEINTTARCCGRDPSEITLVAVSKGYPWEHVQPAYNAGCRVFGESRLQEGLEKMTNAPQDICWHMIGSLQKNKVRKAIGQFTLIHSVDTPELAEKISACSLEANIVTPILLQVNTSGEHTKHGMSSEQWRRFFDSLLILPSIRLEGLMAMAPYTDEEAVIRDCFAQLRHFREELSTRAGTQVSMRHLSMGMSNDYRLAISEGATLLRIGTAIFQKNSD